MDPAKEETMCSKICKLICLMIPLVFSIVLALLSYQLAGRASALNGQQDPNGNLAIKPYDSCDTWTFQLPLADLGLGSNEIDSFLGDITGDLIDQLDDLEDQIDDQMDDWSEGMEDADWDLEWDEDWDGDLDLDAEWDDFWSEDTLDDSADAITDSLDDLGDWMGTNWGIDIMSEGTGWTMIYNFNTVMYLILAIQTLLLIIAVFVVKMRKCLACMGCCTCTTQLVMAIMTLAYAYDSAGEQCSMNNEQYDLSGNTFAKDYDILSRVAVIGIIAWPLMCCCPGCTARVSQ